MNKILQDRKNGWLPNEEIPGFAWFMIRRAFWVIFGGAVLATAVWLLTH